MLLVVNVIVLAFLIVSTKSLVKVVRIPNRFLGVAVLTLSLVGVYSMRNSLIDCVIAAAFGVFGFILKRLNLPIVPVILGMVLGRIMDEKFRASMARVSSPLDFIDRPVSGTIFALIVAALSTSYLLADPRPPGQTRHRLTRTLSDAPARSYPRSPWQ